MLHWFRNEFGFGQKDGVRKIRREYILYGKRQTGSLGPEKHFAIERVRERGELSKVILALIWESLNVDCVSTVPLALSGPTSPQYGPNSPRI